MISCIIPCYNEEEALPLFYREIGRVADEMGNSCHVSFEFIFVDDGSKDETLSILHKLAQTDSRVRYLSFSRNFGKEAAMLAGFEHSNGHYVAVMDADMQDPPSLLPEMYSALENEEFDSVATCRVSRNGEPPIRSFFARCFYKLMNRISDADIVDGARDFRLMRREMIDCIISMKEYNRFSKGIFGWIGFKTKWLPYENVERIAGQTKWSFWKLFCYSLEGILAFSTVPLAISFVLGVVLFLLSLIAICVVVVKTAVFGDPVGGWPSLICIILFIGGIQLFCTGILGQYLAKTYLEVKNRPIYLIKETNAQRSESSCG